MISAFMYAGFRTWLLSFLAFTNQSFAQFVGILQVGVKMLVTILPLVLFREQIEC